MKRLILVTIVAAFKFAATAAQDFVYILPSKEIAETGEDLWFKAYLMDRQTFALSDRSQTLYLQIRTATDSVVWSEKYPLDGGRGNGHIYVGTDWPQGEYFIEGYTQSSFTADSTQAIRPRRIRVVERVAQMDDISAKVVRDDSAQQRTATHRFDLFPEGGNLIYGVNSVVAFKELMATAFLKKSREKSWKMTAKLLKFNVFTMVWGNSLLRRSRAKSTRLFCPTAEPLVFRKSSVTDWHSKLCVTIKRA